MQKLQGFVEQGNTTLTIGQAAGVIARKVQGSFPSATITVYISSAPAVAISAISRTTNVVTVTVPANSGFIAGESVTVAGVTDASFNGTFTILTSGATTFTYAQTAGNASSSSGTASSTLRLAPIYSDNSGTAKANPFVAGTDATWFFYAPNGTYDVKFSGGGISTPFTLGGFTLFDEISLVIDATAAPYFATGNGSTVDAAAIQAALNDAISSSKHRAVFLPSKNAAGGAAQYNLGSTTLTCTDGVSLISDDGGASFLYSGTSYAIDFGSASASTSPYMLKGFRIIMSNDSGIGIRLTRVHNWNLEDLYIEGNVANTPNQQNVGVVVDSLTGDCLFGHIKNVQCQHVKIGFQPKSTGTVNGVTTIVFDGFNVFGDLISGSKGIDFGAFGCGDGFVQIGGNYEDMNYGIYSDGGAGHDAHRMQCFGVRFEANTVDVHLGAFTANFGFWGCLNLSVIENSGTNNLFMGSFDGSSVAVPNNLPGALTVGGNIIASNFKVGAGAPESNVSGVVGDLYLENNGSAAAGVLFVKIAGSGNTGWARVQGFELSGSNFIQTMPGGTVTYFILPDNTGDHRITLQAGTGTAAGGGATHMFSQAHSTNPGDWIACIGQASGGKFRFNSSGLFGGTDLVSWDGSGLVVLSGGAASGFELPEISDPAAPAANKGRLYVRDNGAGKSQLVVRFPSGAIQVISTEP